MSGKYMYDILFKVMILTKVLSQKSLHIFFVDKLIKLNNNENRNAFQT